MTATRLLHFFKTFTHYHDHCFAPLAAAHDLSMREVHVLLFLANHPCYDTARDITEYRGMSKSQVSQAVDYLTEIGFLSRRTDSEDRRVIHLSITDDGWEVSRQAQQIQAECMKELFAGMTEAQQKQLGELWELILTNGERLAGELKA